MKNIQAPTQTISKKAVSLWRISSILSFLFSIIVYISLLFATSYFNWYSWITPVIYGLIGLTIFYTLYKITIYPVYMQRTWRYEIDEDFIQLKHGFLNRHHTIVPMSRVEYVNTEQGPLLRRFELSVLTIGTLASTHEIPALTLTEATIVRNKIARLAQIDSNHPNEMNEQAQTPDMRLNENDMNNDTYEDEYKDE